MILWFWFAKIYHHALYWWMKVDKACTATCCTPSKSVSERSEFLCAHMQKACFPFLQKEIHLAHLCQALWCRLKYNVRLRLRMVDCMQRCEIDLMAFRVPRASTGATASATWTRTMSRMTGMTGIAFSSSATPFLFLSLWSAGVFFLRTISITSLLSYDNKLVILFLCILCNYLIVPTSKHFPDLNEFIDECKVLFHFHDTCSFTSRHRA